MIIIYSATAFSTTPPSQPTFPPTQWLFLLDHESSGKVEASINTAIINFEKCLDEWSINSPTAVENALFELDQWGFTDGDLLHITLGDKEDIPFFLRTCLLGIIRPGSLEEGDENVIREVRFFAAPATENFCPELTFDLSHPC